MLHFKRQSGVTGSCDDVRRANFPNNGRLLTPLHTSAVPFSLPQVHLPSPFHTPLASRGRAPARPAITNRCISMVPPPAACSLPGELPEEF